LVVRAPRPSLFPYTTLFRSEWQRYVLEHSLGEREDGRWCAFEVAVVVPRQNGKNVIIEARELAGLFLWGEKVIIHSAHQVKTARDRKSTRLNSSHVKISYAV